MIIKMYVIIIYHHPYSFIYFSPRDAPILQSALGDSKSSVSLSVRLSVSVPFRYRDHIGSNTLKIITQPSSCSVFSNRKSYRSYQYSVI